MQFVLDNTLNESISTEGCVNLSLDERHAILLFPFPRTLKRNVHEEIRTALRQAQQAFHQYMRIDISLYIGELCNDLPSLKKQILTFWMVNLVMELELKYIVMQHFVSNFKAELLHLGERISMEEMAGRLERRCRGTWYWHLTTIRLNKSKSSPPSDEDGLLLLDFMLIHLGRERRSLIPRISGKYPKLRNVSTLFSPNSLL